MIIINIVLLAAVQMVLGDIKNCQNSMAIDPPRDVHDLHPSHIKLVASIGDSITKAVAAINVETTYISESDFKQYPGLSWLSGGDEGTYSIANYLHYYSPDLFGSSIGVKPLPLCEKTFFCPTYPNDFETDKLNAAIPSATSNLLEEQVDYLLEHIGLDSPYKQQWALINVFIGTNDISVSCSKEYRTQNYRNNVEKTIARLKEKVDYAIVNLIGPVHTENIMEVSNRDPNYRKHFQDSNIDPQQYECLCCRIPVLGKIDIGSHVAVFNDVLQEVANDYGPGGKLGSSTFTVVYQPFPLKIRSIPIDAISNIDGYHPGIKSHRFFSKALWKEMFLPKCDKYEELEYDEDMEVYCPTASDRIRTD